MKLEVALAGFCTCGAQCALSARVRMKSEFALAGFCTCGAQCALSARVRMKSEFALAGIDRFDRVAICD